MFNECIDALKGPSYYPLKYHVSVLHMLSKNYYATWMLLEKLCYLNVL